MVHAVRSWLLRDTEKESRSTQGPRAGTKSDSEPQLSAVSISDFLKIVNSTYHGFLSNEVTGHLGYDGQDIIPVGENAQTSHGNFPLCAETERKYCGCRCFHCHFPGFNAKMERINDRICRFVFVKSGRNVGKTRILTEKHRTFLECSVNCLGRG